jgi:molybdopterin-synthase adenylyltransferase
MLKPRVKPVHNPARLPDGAIRIGSMQFGVGAEIRSSDNDAIWRLLQLMDGSRSEASIVEGLLAESPALDRDSVREILQALIEGGFVEDAGAESPAELTTREIERYARGTNFYAWVDTTPRASPWEVQRRLRKSRVTVLGLGGAGSALVTGLVTSGVGSVRCVDYDRVELSNLNRQTLYTEADVGSSKVDRAVTRLQALNADVEVTGEERRVAGPEDIEELMRGCDLFALCADQPEPFELLGWTNRSGLKTQCPWVMSFYAGPAMVVGLQVPFRAPCYRCLRHAAEVANRIEGDEMPFLIPELVVNAVIAPTAALTGSLAALEAIYYLSGLKPQTVGRIFHQSLSIYDYSYYVEGDFWEDCPDCAGARAVAEDDDPLVRPPPV